MKTALISGEKPRRRQTRRMAIRIRRLLSLCAPFVLLLTNEQTSQPALAIFNCFDSGMFKGKHGGAGGQPILGGPERANWYPAVQANYGPLPPQFGGMHPMKLLFQPKWKSGSSLFGGGKGWNMGWRMGGNSNFYRPNLGYTNVYGGGGLPTGGYQFGEQLNVAPFSVPMNQYPAPVEMTGGGWSLPGGPVDYSQPNSQVIQQSQISGYGESGSYTPPPPLYIQPPAKQQIVVPTADAYGGGSGTKGGGATSGNINSNKYTTTKNVLVANGGYDFHDAHLTSALANKTPAYGHAYPDWYSTSPIESPAKIAQQLLKHGLKKQLKQVDQQQLEAHQNQSAPLLKLQASTTTNPSRFIILDEPRFVGFGTIDILNNGMVRLSCAFNEPIDQKNPPLWVRFMGFYNSSASSQLGADAKATQPAFNCANSQCRAHEIDSSKDYRYKVETGPATSTLTIAEPRLADYGVYRCSALSKPLDGNPLETLYQIVQLQESILNSSGSI